MVLFQMSRFECFYSLELELTELFALVLHWLSREVDIRVMLVRYGVGQQLAMAAIIVALVLGMFHQ